MKQKKSLGVFITLMLLASALVWAFIALASGFLRGNPESQGVLVRDFSALLSAIEDNYIGDYDQKAVATAAMRAAVDALDDPWSFYMTAQEFSRSLDSSHNRYEGIGVNVASDEVTRYIKVLSLIPGAAAEDAGILPGDLITAVDGRSVYGMTIVDLRQLLVRPIGQTALISVIRENGDSEDITVTFGHVFLDPIEFIMLEGNVGFVRINNFNNGSAQSFISAVSSLIEQGAKALIFDVRSNPGGWVTEMSEMLDFLLPEGEIFVTVDRDGNESVTMSDKHYIDLPMAVLVDSFSFSGAEFFAALLSEYDAAYIIGEQTTGKSRIQRLVRLPCGGAINISFAEYLTKNRVSLHDSGGITPDYVVILSDEELDLFLRGDLPFDQDPQLQKALSILPAR